MQPYNTTRAEASQAPTAASPNQVDVESISKKGDVRSLTRTYTTTTYGTKKKCAGCKKMFGTDDYIIAGDKNWHEACFLCTSCGKKANPHRYLFRKVLATNSSEIFFGQEQNASMRAMFKSSKKVVLNLYLINFF